MNNITFLGFEIQISYDDYDTHEVLLQSLDDKMAYDRMSKAHNPYVVGDACKKIVDFLKVK